MPKTDKDIPPTIYDVAERSGVSIATVSRVLNSSERVSEASRKKVVEAINELGFVPKAEARARALQSTGRIGVVTPFFTSPSFIDRLRGVATALSNARLELVIYTVNSMEHLQDYLAALPLTGNLDGLILMSLPLDQSAANHLLSNHLETVLIEVSYPGFSAVLGDDYEGGRLAAQHLINLGHQRCAYVYFSDHPPYSIHPEIQRLAGFRDVLAEHGHDLTDEYTKYLPVTRKGIRQKLLELFELPERPTAIFAPADDLAIRVIHRARELGIDVPGDLSVIGYDDIEIAEHVDLTTINQSLKESGRTAVDMLLARLAESSRPTQQIRLHVHLVERLSTRVLNETAAQAGAIF